MPRPSLKILACTALALGAGAVGASAAPPTAALEFESAVPGTVLDKDGEGTGFTSIVPDGDPATNVEYDPTRIDLQAGNGRLVLTATQGTSAVGNTMRNGMDLTFDSTGTKVISTRILVPSVIDKATQQGGVYFGPDQDNYVKLVAIAAPGNAKRIQLYREFAGVEASIGTVSFTQAQWDAIVNLDLYLQIDSDTGQVSATYQIDGGPVKTVTTTNDKLAATFRIKGADALTFFGTDAHAGLVAFTQEAADIPVRFERFSVSDDVEPPTVIGTTPDAGSAGHPVDGNVVVGFSEAVDPLTINTSSVKLIGPSGEIPVDRRLGVDDVELTIDPVVTLSEGTTYTVQLTTGITDQAGNPMAQPVSFSFTTAAPAPPPPPPAPAPPAPAATSSGSGAPASSGPTLQELLAIGPAPRCKTVKLGTVPKIASRLDERTLIEIQRNAQDALRRIAAIESRLDKGLRGRDLCGGSFTADKFVTGMGLGTGAAVAQKAATPNKLKIAKRPTGFTPSGRKLTARQLLINQRVAQAAIRRLDALERRLNGRLTGYDLGVAAVTADKLAPGLVITQEGGTQPPRVAPPKPSTKKGKGGKVVLTLAQVRINERISAAALRRANKLVAKVEGGFSGADFADGSIAPRQVK